MTELRLHHPSCPARAGGLCFGCPIGARAPKDHEPDITCQACGETFTIAAENPIARERALRDWPGCPCTTDTLRPGGPTSASRVGGELPGRGATNLTRAADGPAARVMARWVSGRPGWVRRRAAVAW